MLLDGTRPPGPHRRERPSAAASRIPGLRPR
jgi:hypothetical protein